MLARIRDRFTRRYWTVPLCLAVTLFLTSEGGNLLNAQPRRTARVISDADLYRGIFFADGPVADLIPEIRDNLKISNVVNDRTVLRAFRGLHARIIAQIAQTYPAFLSSFGQAMRSGDHLRIDRALEDAAVVTIQAISEMPEIEQLRAEMQDDPGLRGRLLAAIQRTEGADGLSSGEIEKALDLVLADSQNLKDDEDPQGLSIVSLLGWVAAVVAAITVAVLLSYGAVLNVAVAINYWKWKPFKDSEPKTDLFREQLIDSVAVTFGPVSPSF